MNHSPSDERWMRLALHEAEKGRGFVSPNPMVGAVIVKNARLIAAGHHARYGGEHAEVRALGKAGLRARGAVLYVTLEPCASWGKTPPCADAIADSGIREVVIACADPNPANHGKSRKFLKRRGVRVRTGVLEKEAAELNRGFFTWIEKGRPFVTLKMAQSLDGKIAAVSGQSRWITGSESRLLVQRLRASHDAVLVGYKTALLDNPGLTVRGIEAPGERPWRIIMDPRGMLPRSHKVLHGGPVTIRAVTKEAFLRLSRKRKAAQRETDVLLPVKADGRKLNLSDLLRRLAALGITSLLVEGGGETTWSLIEGGLADRLCFFTAPRIIGGRTAKTSVEGEGIRSLKDSFMVRNMRCTPVGQDWLFEGEL